MKQLELTDREQYHILTLVLYALGESPYTPATDQEGVSSALRLLAVKVREGHDRYDAELRSKYPTGMIGS